VGTPTPGGSRQRPNNSLDYADETHSLGIKAFSWTVSVPIRGHWKKIQDIPGSRELNDCNRNGTVRREKIRGDSHNWGKEGTEQKKERCVATRESVCFKHAETVVPNLCAGTQEPGTHHFPTTNDNRGQKEGRKTWFWGEEG